MDSRNLGLNSSISGNDGILDRILVYMGKTCKQENGTSNIFNNDNDDSMQFINNPMNVALSEGLPAKFMHLPGLESPTNIAASLADNNSSSFSQDCSFGACEQPMNDSIIRGMEPSGCTNQEPNCNINTTTHDEPIKVGGLSDWVAFDRLVASQLNGQATDHSCRDEVFCFPLEQEHEHQDTYLTNLRSSSCSTTSNSTRPNNQASQVYMMSNEVDFWSFARSSSSSSSDPLCHLSV